jgi:hypothetical protein
MIMIELFKRQIENVEKPKIIKDKKYFNGDEIKDGDFVLYALVLDETIKDGNVNLKLEALNQSHFN